MMTDSKPRVLFLSHGGGPLPLLGDPAHLEMVLHLRAIAERMPRPSAILVVSAHWEEQAATLTSGANPEVIYDYYGFPAASYEIQYPCPGEPELAGQVRRLLGDAGIEARLDAQRGFDHGLFVPLKLMYPEADIPCIQLSLVSGLDPAEHIAIGRAQRLEEWALAPFARYCHPREEHLLPLHVCYGIAQSACSEYFQLEILHKKSSMYLW